MRGHNYKKPVVTSNMRLYFWRKAYRERRSKITEAFFSSARQLTAGATQMFSHQPSLQQLLAAATGLQIWSHVSLQTAGRVKKHTWSHMIGAQPITGSWSPLYVSTGIILNTEPLKSVKVSSLWRPAQLHFYIDKNISVRNDCGSKQELEHYSHNSEQNGCKDQLNDLMNKTTDQTVSVTVVWKVWRTKTAKIKINSSISK